MVEIRLYHTSGCHLCEKARDILWPLLSSEHSFLEIDVADSDVLIERYGIRIPVIVINDRELGWPFDQSILKRFIFESGNSAC